MYMRLEVTKSNHEQHKAVRMVADFFGRSACPVAHDEHSVTIASRTIPYDEGDAKLVELNLGFRAKIVVAPGISAMSTDLDIHEDALGAV